MSFLHGVETITTPSAVIVNDIKTAVIGLIGTAATGDVDTLYLCTTEDDDAVFGSSGSIPEALKAIRKQGAATVFVVSVGTGTPEPVAADFEGAVDPTTGARTGLRVFDLCFNLYGFTPKIFIAPRFSIDADIMGHLITTATKFRGHAYIDAPVGITPAAAIALRATGQQWATVSPRAMLFYPMLIDSTTDTATPFSAYAAGVRAQVDNTPETVGGGFWVSSSNHEIKGITGLETDISASINDVTAETNALNAQGITTVFNTFGTGFRLWGNRSAAYPTAISDPTNFECVQRAKDIIDESIELAMLPYIDKPIIQAYIDAVRNTVNTYFNSLIARGAALEGSKCIYEPSKNSSEELAKGHVVFTNIYMTPTPGERITFDTTIDTSLLTFS